MKPGGNLSDEQAVEFLKARSELTPERLPFWKATRSSFRKEKKPDKKQKGKHDFAIIFGYYKNIPKPQRKFLKG
jgi:hypothetical protein